MKQGYFGLFTTMAPAVKEAQFFIDQGGLDEEWGEPWEYFEAYDLADAYMVAMNIYKDRQDSLK